MKDKQEFREIKLRVSQDEYAAFEAVRSSSGRKFQSILHSFMTAFVNGAAVPKAEQPAPVPVPTRMTEPDANSHDAGGATVDEKFDQLATLIGEVVGELRKLAEEVRGNQEKHESHRGQPGAGRLKAG